MADLNSVLAKVLDAFTETQLAAGVPTDASVIAGLQATNASLSAEVALLKLDLAGIQSALDKAKADAV